jgi:hypothetical protein
MLFNLYCLVNLFGSVGRSLIKDGYLIINKINLGKTTNGKEMDWLDVAYCIG